MILWMGNHNFVNAWTKILKGSRICHPKTCHFKYFELWALEKQPMQRKAFSDLPYLSQHRSSYLPELNSHKSSGVSLKGRWTLTTGEEARSQHHTQTDCHTLATTHPINSSKDPKNHFLSPRDLSSLSFPY